LTDSDGIPERVVIYKHNYKELFKNVDLSLLKWADLANRPGYYSLSKVISLNYLLLESALEKFLRNIEFK